MVAVDDRSVVVENLSTTATEKDLQEFFSFCGAVEGIRIEAGPDGKTQVAHVTFDDVESVGTAVLLSDAIIAEAPISIRPVNDSIVDASAANVSAPRAAAASAAPELQAKPRESATEIVLRMIAVGYIKGDAFIREVKARALKFDREHGLTVRAKTAATPAINWAQQKSEKLDDQYKLKQKAAFASFAFEKALNVGSSAVTRGVKAFKAGKKGKKGAQESQAQAEAQPSSPDAVEHRAVEPTGENAEENIEEQTPNCGGEVEQKVQQTEAEVKK